MSAVCEKCSGRGYETCFGSGGKAIHSKCACCRGSGKAPMPLASRTDAAARRLIAAADARLKAGAK